MRGAGFDHAKDASNGGLHTVIPSVACGGYRPVMRIADVM